MARTKATEKIRLSGGRVMTLGEALDDGVVVLRAPLKQVLNKQTDKVELKPQYLATEVSTGDSWDVGEMLYKSRMKLLPNASPDLSHLNALELRLSHERERLRAARTPREKAFRAQQVASCEREIAGERKFLSEQGVDLSVDDGIASLSDDELLAELEPNAPSKLEWVKGDGVDRDGHNLTWWKNKVAKWKSQWDRPTVFIKVTTWDRAGQRDKARSAEFEPDDLPHAKAFAKEATLAGGSSQIDARVDIPHQNGITFSIGEWRNTASNGYYVWSVDRESYVPVARNGPFENPDDAIALAKRKAASGQTYDEVVTFGGDPEAGDFSIWRSFKAWSGEVHYTTDLPKVAGRLREYR